MLHITSCGPDANITRVVALPSRAITIACWASALCDLAVPVASCSFDAIVAYCGICTTLTRFGRAVARSCDIVASDAFYD
jgi:hypothetical protein